MRRCCCNAAPLCYHARIYFFRPLKVEIMKRTLPSWLCLVIGGIALVNAWPALAQDKKTAPPPPKLEKLEEGPESDIKLIKPETGKLKTVERKEAGRVVEVQVRTGKSQYTVKPNQADKGTREGDANRAAQWKVLEFGGKKETKVTESLPELPVGPNSTSKTGSVKTTPASASASASAAASASASASASSASAPPPQKDKE